MANLPEARRKSRRLREGNNMIKLENWSRKEFIGMLLVRMWHMRFIL